MPTLPVTPAEVAVAWLLVTLGATVQGSVGFGLAVVSAPLLLLMNPIFVPGPLLLAAMLLTFLISYRERHEVIRRDVAVGMLGRILGTIPAAYVVSILPQELFNALFASMVLLAVLLSLRGWHIRPTPVNVLAASTLSGFTGTIAATGGPPMALVYQREEGPRIRGTMSSIFLVGTVVSIAGLWWAGRFGVVQLVLGLFLYPAVYIGFRISRTTSQVIDRAHSQPAILAVSTLSALVIFARVLW